MNELEEAGLRLKLAAAERERDELKAALKVHEDELTGAASGATKTLILKLTKERDSLAAKCAEMQELIKGIECKCDTATLGGFTCPRCQALAHNYASDCGRDYVPRSQLEEARNELERMKSQTGSCSVCGNTVWSQEDDRGIAHCIVCALSAERDSLRAALKECVEALESCVTRGESFASPFCYRCGMARYKGHTSDCQIGQALAKAKEVLK